MREASTLTCVVAPLDMLLQQRQWKKPTMFRQQKCSLSSLNSTLSLKTKAIRFRHDTALSVPSLIMKRDRTCTHLAWARTAYSTASDAIRMEIGASSNAWSKKSMAKMFISKMMALNSNKTESNDTMHKISKVTGLKKGAQMAHLLVSRRMNNETGLLIRWTFISPMSSQMKSSAL